MLESRSSTLSRIDGIRANLSLLEMDHDREGDHVFSIREEEEGISLLKESDRGEKDGEEGGRKEEREWIHAIGQGEEGERTYLASSLSLSLSLSLPCSLPPHLPVSDIKNISR